MFSRALLAITLVACLDVRAFAHGDAGARQLPDDAPAVTKEGEKAKAELARVSAAAGPKELLAEPVKKGKAAIARAHGASLAGDEVGAKLLSRIALAWSQAAAATLRAFESERSADAAETKTTARKEQIQRKKALLVEMEARKMSLTKELASLESEPKAPPASTPEKAPKKTGAVEPKKAAAEKPAKPAEKPKK